VGTKLKYALTIRADGFDMDEDDFMVEIKRGANSIVLKKEDIERDSEGQYYVCFDTTELGSGSICAVVTAYVPDADFPDGVRTEVMKINLIVARGV